MFSLPVFTQKIAKMKIYFYKSLMTCIPRFLNFFSASDIMEAARVRFHFYDMKSHIVAK